MIKRPPLVRWSSRFRSYNVWQKTNKVAFLRKRKKNTLRRWKKKRSTNSTQCQSSTSPPFTNFCDYFSPTFPNSPCHRISPRVSASIISTLLKLVKPSTSKPEIAFPPSASPSLFLVALLQPSASVNPPLAPTPATECVRVRVREDEPVVVVGSSLPIPLAVAISICVREMKSRMPETRRFMSFMVVRLGFIWRGFEGFPFSAKAQSFMFI